MTRRMDVDRIRRQVEAVEHEDLIEAVTAVVEWLRQHPRTRDGMLAVDGDIVLDIIAEQIGAT